MEFHDQYSIVEKVNAVVYKDKDKISRKIKSIVFDNTLNNFGIINDRFVVVDLGDVDLETVKQNLYHLKNLYHS